MSDDGPLGLIRPTVKVGNRGDSLGERALLVQIKSEAGSVAGEVESG